MNSEIVRVNSSLEWLNMCPSYTWIKINDIPLRFRYNVINLIDKGYPKYKRVFFNDLSSDEVSFKII